MRDLFETYVVPPAMARAEILRIWKALPNETVDHGNGVRSRKAPNLPAWLAKQPDEALEGILTAYEEMEREWKLRQSKAAPEPVSHAHDDGAKTATLVALRPHFEDAFREHVANDYSEDEMAELDEETLVELFDEFLDRERSIRVRDDGLIQFWMMEPELHEACEENDLMVVLFHYTSSSKLTSIKRNGLEGGRRSVNRRTAEGVYLTTETGGPAVEGYKRNACRGNRGSPVCITVKCHLYELSDDTDDIDIQSGAHQYVMPQVPPDRFVDIERC